MKYYKYYNIIKSNITIIFKLYTGIDNYILTYTCRQELCKEHLYIV